MFLIFICRLILLNSKPKIIKTVLSTKNIKTLFGSILGSFNKFRI